MNFGKYELYDILNCVKVRVFSIENFFLNFFDRNLFYE